MASFNKVILMGRCVNAPELKQTQGGATVTNFTIAVDRKYNKGEEKQADFINIIAWRHTAEFICKYFGKGSAILIEGELQTRSWTDQQGNKRYATEVVASEVTFCEAKKNSEGTSLPQTANGSQSENSGAYGYNPYSAPNTNFDSASSDDDLPF